MPTTLLAVPNFSEGRDKAAIDAIGAAFGTPPLDVHFDPDHHRTVFTLAGAPGQLAQAVLAGARGALEIIDVTSHDGAHPRVGAADVAGDIHVIERAQRGALGEAAREPHPLQREVGVLGEIAFEPVA